MNTAIVTGASGFIGARIARQLLESGWRVHALGRSKGRTCWRDRMISSLDDTNGRAMDREALSGLQCHETDLLRPDLGLAEPASMRLTKHDALLFHVAGDTRFTPPDTEAQRQTNVMGSVNVFSCFGRLVRQAVHVSTAYVAGDRQGIVLEDDSDVGQAHRNPYEKSKLEAELAVRDICCGTSLPLIIVRPSIITNDTQTGRSSTFTHLNALVEVVSRIQEHFGIRDGQVVSEEIRLPVNPHCRPNLAPVDPIVTSLVEIASNPQAPGRVYHLCHPGPQSNAEVMSLLAEAFGVKGKVALSFVSQLQKPLSWTERMFVRSFKPYLPYLNESCVFDLTNTRRSVPDYDSRFPALSVDYLRKVIQWQRDHGNARLRE
ncbi:MAG: SDR family oxidoreductase [Planctomycetota bacterium]|nr:SDR family oxidoreductase [Planctomycetota bacterium]